jgi:serine phosphatase RsbU (regulator of sigma subunit)
MTVAYLDCASHRLVFSNAGNLPVYIVRPDECVTYAVPGYPCGFTPEAQYAERTVSLRQGDQIVLMTDGLVERGRIAGYVNVDAVRSLMMHFWGRPDFNARVLSLMLEMFPDHKFYDDATLISVDLH